MCVCRSVKSFLCETQDTLEALVVCLATTFSTYSWRHQELSFCRDTDAVPSNVQSARQEALLYVFEDNEAVIKVIIKGRSPTMRHVSRTHRVALDWLFDRINLDSEIQIKYIDTKNQLADILTKGNFTRDEWNHLLSLFNVSHFSSTVCSAAMAKRIQQESGEERVTAKSRPMMNLTARMPSVVSSSTSSSLVKKYYGNQDPWKSVVVDDRSGQPDRLSPAGYSKSDYDRSWSSQEWKSEVTAHDRSGKLDKTSWNAVEQIRLHHEDTLLDGGAQSVRYGERLHDGSGQPDSANYQEEADSETFVMGSDAAELELSVKKTETNVERCRFWRRTFNNLVNVYGCDDECGDIHGKEFHGFHRSHLEENVRHLREIGERTGRD